ncbi:hypothetical protein A2U01_0032830, partial [Trifolium medium]|nr:hypothetical protein [Trifolium medium]
MIPLPSRDPSRPVEMEALVEKQDVREDLMTADLIVAIIV